MLNTHAETVALLRTAIEALDKVGASNYRMDPEGEAFSDFWFRLMGARDGFEFRHIMRDFVARFPAEKVVVQVPGIEWSDGNEPRTRYYDGTPGTWFNVFRNYDGDWVAYHDDAKLGNFPTRADAMNACESVNILMKGK
jgi:hypothetical protein